MLNEFCVRVVRRGHHNRQLLSRRARLVFWFFIPYILPVYFEFKLQALENAELTTSFLPARL